jgi:uncharacterized repeat protein (TIGR01451 family)
LSVIIGPCSRRANAWRGWIIDRGGIRLKRILLFGVLVTLILAAPNSPADYDNRVNADSVDRIQCPPGYVASVFAEGLASPDGLALDPEDTLYVAEETSGRVSRIGADGGVLPVLSGLQYPEGIAFDDQGNLYVVEDVAAGRVIKRAADGTVTTLSADRDAPEGVVWAPDGVLYITESNVQFASPLDFETHVTRIDPLGGTASVRTDAFFWSYAGIEMGADGLLYVTNEASGTGTTDSVFIVDPASGSRTLLASGLETPEGLRFSPGGMFPLFVAEEGDGDGTGRLSQVQANGDHAPFCTGFLSVEDVVLDAQGRLYVSEDGSGSIIRIEPALSLSQAAVPPDGASVAPGETISYTLVLTNNRPAELTGLVLTDTLPLSVILVSDTVGVPPGWSRVEAPPSRVILTGALAQGEAVQVSLAVTVTYGRPGKLLENTAEVRSREFGAFASIITHKLSIPPGRSWIYLPRLLRGPDASARARGRR